MDGYTRCGATNCGLIPALYFFLSIEKTQTTKTTLARCRGIRVFGVRVSCPNPDNPDVKARD